MPLRFLPAAFAALTVLFSAASQAQAQTDNHAYDNQNYDNRARNQANDQESASDKFTQNEIVQAASGFFGMTTEAVAKAVQKVFSEQGLPDAYITGEEGSGAIIVGLRYGSGWLIRKHHKARKVYWQGPSVGFDIGGNASKSFTLVYNLRSADRLFQKFPGIEGTYYFIAGIGVNYLRAGDITLAPMRTGVGLRAGVNAGYLTFTREESLNPF
ncbi:MAG: DUF1134 domain-containing protein [Alphaproteobacteria bacterium]|jgi:hypothetical protein|nr:DUF1134 domain-containing protein [Alphaproteobacteria bacterium]MBN9558447.1 DUF1134 domain-containing protein [Alphaproteobacteria bacterium]MBN9567978.1 DUF1134 domain-containing protein [Alphaproteobacteria bacterium]MBN9569964.1 DUF1134 domain-containing protein [Alphaproteobacteria bacterium]OJU55710.1 MAG: hypothetical protein BGO00_13855 [Alphaproteobacteria bacterium 62-8]